MFIARSHSKTPQFFSMQKPLDLCTKCGASIVAHITTYLQLQFFLKQELLCTLTVLKQIKYDVRFYYILVLIPSFKNGFC